MPSTTRRLMLRWSWRDLRRRWGLVLLTAVIIAIGTGTYAGLGGTTPWRIGSLDASYHAQRYHDLVAVLPTSAYADQGSLATAIRGIDDADQITAIEERLTVPTQVDASHGGQTILVPGEVVGLAADPEVDTLHVDHGRGFRSGDREVVLESKFARQRHLPRTGTLELGGGTTVHYTGTGFTPEYFRVLGQSQNLAGAYGYAVVFASLPDAQRLTGHDHQVNSAAIRLRPGADVTAIRREVTAALAKVGATVDTRADDVQRRSMYADARNDQKTWIALSVLILFGASFAAFNLVNRMVEAERHEIGVGMALGTPPRLLSIRPLLVGLQIAIAGVILGVGVGLYAGSVMRGLLVEFLPLSVWRTPFPIGRYAQAAALGIALPMLATIIPVRRALRVEPVDALRSQASGTGRGIGFAGALGRRRHRGRVVASMPLRNVARSPRRTLLTALGIAASITSLVAVLGMLDTIDTTFSRSDGEVARQAPDRLEVALSSFQLANSDVVTAIERSPAVASAEPGLRLSGTMRTSTAEVETVIDLIDLRSAMWRPSVVAGSLPYDGPGLVISEKAASDLGVGPGDTITLQHPVREGLSYRLVDSKVRVAAIHPNPLRFFTYMDASQASMFDLEGIVDTVTVRPAPGKTADDVKRALFDQQGVGSVQEVAVLGDLLHEMLGQFTGVLRVLEGFGLALALLIALNSASLAMEERRREQATMFAFGLPVGTVLRTIVLETFVTALIGTIIGIFSGIAALAWLMHMFTTETFPELGVHVVLSPTSVATVLVLGVGVATLAPVLAVRRLTRTDIPSTLRVLE